MKIEFENRRDCFIKRFQGQWGWIALDPLNRTRTDYINKFLPNFKFDYDCLACEYAHRCVEQSESRCHYCFIDLGEDGCDELVSQFNKYVYEKDEDNAARVAWKISQLPIRKEK